MPSLQEIVAKVFYTHGLLCASHPYSILTSVCCIILLLCYPLVNVPFPGNVPAEYSSLIKDYQEPTGYQRPIVSGTVRDESSIPRWLRGPPGGYIQQFVVKATVSPWNPEQLDPIDALRAPLSKVFTILDETSKYKYRTGKDEVSMVNLCLRVSEPVRNKNSKGLLPEYSCMILSPANLWYNSPKRFYEDPEVLRTLYKRYSQALEAPPGIKDILFGLPWTMTGISRYFIRNRQRTISFAVTVVLKNFSKEYIHGLRSHLETIYPETVKNVNNSRIDRLVHLHYKEINIYFENIHLIILYLVLLLYLYFSVSKIQMVKSKWGLALSAVVTVVCSFLISVSMCSLFGLTPTLNGGEIFPYLVMLIGVENVLILTRSVVSTPIELEVRHRIAAGLCKEGWSITKNLLAELAIVIIGFFTFLPAIQEFCLFALVGLLSDFFLQMVFFVTVLSVDIRRMELSDLNRNKQNVPSEQLEPQFSSIEPILSCPFKSHLVDKRPKFAPPRLNLSSGTSLMSPTEPQPSPKVQHETRFFPGTRSESSRRLRLIYFWASTRVVQRVIMVCTVLWIALIVYKTGLVQHLTNSNLSSNPTSATVVEQMIKQQQEIGDHVGVSEQSKGNDEISFIASLFGQSDDSEFSSIEHKDLETWRKLSYKYWPTMFGYYNISLSRRYITILPTIHLSTLVPLQEAVDMRKSHTDTKWLATPPITIPGQQHVIGKTHKDQTSDNQNVGPERTEESESTSHKHYSYYYDPQQIQQFYPKSRREFVITISLGVLSVVCVSYFMMLMYRCLCSRKYSKWRASWNKPRRRRKTNNYIKQIKESVPLVLKGHIQEIECLVTEGSVIISSCLGGQLRVWDSLNGECLHCIERKSVAPPMSRKPCEGRNIEDSEADLYAEYHGNKSSETDMDDLELYGYQENSTRHRKVVSTIQDKESAGCISFENEPDLSSTIDTNFSALSSFSVSDSSCLDDSGTMSDAVIETSQEMSQDNLDGYNFTKLFGNIYDEHRKLQEEKNEEDRARRRNPDRPGRSKSWSEGSAHPEREEPQMEGPPAAVWCLACKGSLIVAGCGNGKIEFWDATTGLLKCLYAESKMGVTAVNFVGKRVIASRIDGFIDFLELETFQDIKLSSTPLSPNSLHKKIRGHSRHLSHSRTSSDDARLWTQVIHCTSVYRAAAHQRPVTVLQTEGGRVVSGSQDNTLKVFRLEDCLNLYTLHGHTGSISALYLDKCPPYAAVSGSADGTIRLWDLLTGTCVHKAKGHEGTVVALTCTEVNIISSGLDDRMCVWERKRGHLLYSVDMETSCGSSMSMLCKNFLVTGRQGWLYLWDINKGELVREVNLQNGDRIAYIRHIQALENSTIVCDFGNEIKVIHFPLVLEKVE